MFKQFEKTGPRATRTKKKIVARMVEELSRHVDIEEQVLYPAVRQATKQNTLVFQALEEHALVKPVLKQLTGMEPEEERFEAKVTVLIWVVRRHIKNEERHLLPRIRGALTRSQLEELGQRIVEGKKALKEPEEYLRSS